MKVKTSLFQEGGVICQFPADFVLIATSNLCPCGDYVPHKPTRCHLTLARCRSYLDKMSGPLLDRFSILSFSHQWKGEFNTSLKEIGERIAKAQEFAHQTREQIINNSELDLKSIEVFIDNFVLDNLLPNFEGSHRRKLAVFQVARSMADLKEQRDITVETLNEAIDLCIRPFRELKFGAV